MPILDFWRTNRDTVTEMAIHQVVTNCGDGRLADDGAASEELREFLSQVPSNKIFDYARQCLDGENFDGKGFCLQDVVNQLGRRLDFDVEYGLYRGRSNQIGFDGIWTPATGPAFIVEVKTTDAYLTNLAPLAEYRRKLIASGRVADDSTTLIVVGRQDTGGLEAQVRGSPFAWTIRILGIEALIKLVRVKEQSSSGDVLRQMHEILRPIEYTRVDKIIDLVFTTAEDIEETDEELSTGEDGTAIDDQRHHNATPRKQIEDKRQAVISAFGERRQKTFIKSRQTLYWTADQTTRICVVVSKRYESDGAAYWYRFDPEWLDFLQHATDGHYILAGMDINYAFAIPTAIMSELTNRLNTTKREDGTYYWHIHLSDEPGRARLRLRGGDSFSVEGFRFVLT